MSGNFISSRLIRHALMNEINPSKTLICIYFITISAVIWFVFNIKCIIITLEKVLTKKNPICFTSQYNNIDLLHLKGGEVPL